jgi:hypothetical protein
VRALDQDDMNTRLSDSTITDDDALDGLHGWGIVRRG